MRESKKKKGHGNAPSVAKLNSDNELVDRILDRKDMDAFAELVGKYQDKVWRLARGITRSDADAEDILQEVFFTVFKKLKTFEGRSSFSSWLYRIAANASYMKLRTRKGTQAYAPQDIAPLVEENNEYRNSEWAKNPEDVTGSKEAVGIINNAIEELPQEYRAVVVLRDIEGFDNVEVADMLGLTVPAVKSRLHRARLLLRKTLMDFFNEEIRNVNAG